MHRWVRRMGKAAVDSYKLVNGEAVSLPSALSEARAQHRQAVWSSVACDQGELDMAWQRLRVAASLEEDVSSLTVKELRRAVRSLHGTKEVGSDLWRPRLLSKLPNVGLQELAGIYGSAERSAAWPISTLNNGMLFLGTPGWARGL